MRLHLEGCECQDRQNDEACGLKHKPRDVSGGAVGETPRSQCRGRDLSLVRELDPTRCN